MPIQAAGKDFRVSPGSLEPCIRKSSSVMRARGQTTGIGARPTSRIVGFEGRGTYRWRPPRRWKRFCSRRGDACWRHQLRRDEALSSSRDALLSLVAARQSQSGRLRVGARPRGYWAGLTTWVDTRLPPRRIPAIGIIAADAGEPVTEAACSGWRCHNKRFLIEALSGGNSCRAFIGSFTKGACNRVGKVVPII